MKIGITGHKGFIGKNLIKHFEQSGQEYVVNNGPYEYDLSCVVYESDIIIHLANKNRDTEEELIDTNLHQSIDLAYQCALQNKKIIYIGTTYQKPGVYKFTKNLFNDVLKRLKENFELQYCIIHAPNIIGPMCKPFYNSFVTTLIYLFSQNKEYKSFINNENDHIQLIHVNDLIYYVVYAIENYDVTDLYAINASKTYTIKEIINILTNDKKYTINVKEKIILDLLEWYKNNVV